MHKRVVVTGLGLISPVSSTASGTFQGLLNGAIGIKEISEEKFPDFADLPIKIGGNLPEDFDYEGALKKTGIIKNFYNALSLSVCQQAFDDSKLAIPDESSNKNYGIIFGTDKSSPYDIRKAAEKVKEGGYSKLDRFIIPKVLISQSLGTIALSLKFKGYANAITAGFVTGQVAVSDAFRAIRLGHAEVMMAGASEVDFDPSVMMSLYKSGLLIRSNEVDQCRPFDIARDGFVYSVGAGAMVLESLEHAVNRGATIYAEILASSSCADTNLEQNNGAHRSMDLAIKKSNIDPKQVELVNADASGLKNWDVWEADAVEKLFGTVAVTSHKGNMGHMLSASGICQSVITALCVKNQIIPPISTLIIPVNENLDYVCKTSMEKNITHAISNSASYDGTSFSSILFKKY